MRISDWSSDVCSSDLCYRAARAGLITGTLLAIARISGETAPLLFTSLNSQFWSTDMNAPMANLPVVIFQFALSPYEDRSEEHTSELQSLMRISYAVFCLKKKTKTPTTKLTSLTQTSNTVIF